MNPSGNSFSPLLPWRNFMCKRLVEIELLLTVSLCGGLFAMATLAIPSSSNAQAIDCVNGQVVSDDPAQNGGPCTGTANDGVDPAVTASSPTLSNDGIFGCLGQGARVQNVCTRAAIGGVYVPVNDAAVTLNTGFLVYKECVLRPLQNRLRESAMSALLKKQYIGIETGREGNKRYVENQGAEKLQRSDKT